MSVRVTQYTVESIYAEGIDPDERHLWELTVDLVDQRGHGRWAVRSRTARLNRLTVELELEPPPSERSESWNADHSFRNEGEAICVATSIVEHVKVNLMTAQQAAAQRAKRQSGEPDDD